MLHSNDHAQIQYKITNMYENLSIINNFEFLDAKVLNVHNTCITTMPKPKTNQLTKSSATIL